MEGLKSGKVVQQKEDKCQGKASTVLLLIDNVGEVTVLFTFCQVLEAQRIAQWRSPVHRQNKVDYQQETQKEANHLQTSQTFITSFCTFVLLNFTVLLLLKSCAMAKTMDLRPKTWYFHDISHRECRLDNALARERGHWESDAPLAPG